MTSPITLKAISIRERLTAMRTAEATTAPTPLSLYLSLYLKAHRESYIDHMHGAKVLYHHLKPILLPTDTPPIAPSLMTVLSSYETLELAKIVSGYGTDTYNLTSLYNAHKSVIYNLYKRLDENSYEENSYD